MVFSRHNFFLTSKFRARIERNLLGAASNQSQRLRPTPWGESNKRTMRDEEGTQEGDEEKRQVAFTNRDHSRRGVRYSGRPAFVFSRSSFFPMPERSGAGPRSRMTPCGLRPAVYLAAGRIVTNCSCAGWPTFLSVIEQII